MARHRAFTLVEMLVVVFVVGLLATTVSISLSSLQSRDLGREGERLAILLQEVGLKARMEGVSYEWRPVGAGAAYAFLALDSKDEGRQATAKEYGLPEGFRVAAMPAGDTRGETVLIPARGIAGPVHILLTRGDDAVDVRSDGLNRYTVSAVRTNGLGAANARQ